MNSVVEHWNPLVGERFGQEERLTVRLRGLVRAYPRSVGIVKEFLQNADDAGATWLRVIWDDREHPRERLPDPRMAALQGPALLFVSDQVFRPTDLDAIRRIGESSKAALGPKTGRFGLGFNTAYNVTDHPSFVSGPWAVAFDPHHTSVSAEGQGTGRRWALDDLWRLAPDWLAAFAAGGLQGGDEDHPATIFRLPVRDAAQAAASDICDEPFERAHFEQMLRDLAESGDELLLFARNVLDLRVEQVDAAGVHRELLRITTVNRDEVAAHRAIGNAAVEGDIAENLAIWRAAPDELPATTYRHTIAVEAPGRTERRPWQVAAGLFADSVDELLGLNEAMVRLHEKAIPWAGAAIRLEDRDEGGLVIATQRGKLFCTFPLADQPEALPFHCDACFDLDSSRRSISSDESAYAETDRVRAQWNQALLRHAVPQAAALAIAALVPEVASASLGRFYALWPDLTRGEEPWRTLYVALVARLAELPLIRTRAGQAIAWCTLLTSRLAPPLFGPDLQEALRDDGLALPDPDLPARVIRGVEAAGVRTRRYRPAELRAWLRLEEPHGAPLAAAPRACLRERAHIVDLLQFCLSDRKDEIAGLPLALTCDGQVRTFGQGEPLFLADDATRHIFAARSDRFIDAGVQQHTRLQPCEPARLREANPAMAVAWLAEDLSVQPGETIAWDPAGDAPPNAVWLALVLRYLAERASTADAATLSTLALLPDRQGRLHRAGDRTLLLPGEDLDRRLQAALDDLGVDLVAGGPDVVAAVRALQLRHPGPPAPLTGPGLAARLAARRDALARLPGPSSERAALLDYLAAPRWLDHYGPDELTVLRTLPLLRTCEGRVISADTPGAHLAGGFRPPALVDVEVELVDEGPGGRWRAFLALLAVPELSLGHFVADVLVPAFASLIPELQRAALLWLRDEVDLRDLERASPTAVARLRRAPLILAHDGRLRPACELHAADGLDEHAALACRAATPNLEFYGGDPTRWHALLRWLGVGDDPPPSLLLQNLDLLLTRHADDPAGARGGLLALFTQVQRRWPGLDQTGAALLQAGLRQRAWLPARAIPGFAAATDRLYRPDELYLPDDLERIASQGPVFAGPPGPLAPDLCEALGFRVASTAAIVAHLEQLRRRWAAADHGGVSAADVESATAAIYAALGDPSRELPQALLDSLSRRACVWDPERQRFWIPAHAFAVPVADLFGELRGHVPGATDEVRRGLTRIGRRPSPDVDDILAALEGIVTVEGEPLAADDMALALRLLRRLHDRELTAETCRRVPVPTRAGPLRPAADVRVDDAPWFSSRIPADAVAFVHPRVSAETIDQLGLRRLSTSTREELAERPALSGDVDRQHFCRRLTEVIHDPAFVAGIARILVHQGTVPDGSLDLLSDLRIVACDRLISQLHIEGLEQPVGRAEVPVLADEDMSVVYVRGDPWDSLVVQISEAINRLLDGALHNLAHLEAILRTAPEDIVALLDQRRVPRLHDVHASAAAPVIASGTAPARELPSVLTHDRVAAVEAGPTAPTVPDVIAAAIAAARASERAAGREATVTRSNHPGYDLQVGEPGDPAARFIRVVGIDGEWDRVAVELGASYYNAARVFGRNFWLYVVEHALDPRRVKVHRIHDPVSRVARFVFDHRWQVQSEQHTAAADTHLGWFHVPPGGEPAVISAVETIGMFIWLQVRLADGTTERRFFKPNLDRLIPPTTREHADAPAYTGDAFH